MSLDALERPVIFFDGICNLCNRMVQFIIRHDKKGIFLFAPLQSKTGSELAGLIKEEACGLPDSIILYYKKQVFYRSEAVLMIARLLGGWYKALTISYILPKFIRDGLYKFIARNRYIWFGKRSACMIPTTELNSRFLP